MRILVVSDEECPALWDYYVPGKLKEYDLILSCGDLKASYLSFLVTMSNRPLLYVHGNHDGSYEQDPPGGCDCIDDRVVTYNGIRILGLGGCPWYRKGPHQYTEEQMRKRIRKIRRQIRKAGGVDIVVTHAPPKGVGDIAGSNAHQGFEALLELLDEYKPAYLVHGHVHLRYGIDQTRERAYNQTQVINACERYTLDIPGREVPLKKMYQLIWAKKVRENRNEDRYLDEMIRLSQGR